VEGRTTHYHILLGDDKTSPGYLEMKLSNGIEFLTQNGLFAHFAQFIWTSQVHVFETRKPEGCLHSSMICGTFILMLKMSDITHAVVFSKP
jgi:hypothetical protein